MRTRSRDHDPGSLPQDLGSLAHDLGSLAQDLGGPALRSTRMVISGGTPKRTGRMLVPIPGVTKRCLPFSTTCPIA